jgi:hypothetical protein
MYSSKIVEASTKKFTLKSITMKRNTLLIALLLLFIPTIQAQWVTMQKFEEFGKGNYFLFVQRETDLKRIILETLKDNKMNTDFTFEKGTNLILSRAYLDPLNSEYVLVIHCVKAKHQEVYGYNIFCYYMENRYRYFYDITENDRRISLIYDPAITGLSPYQGKSNKKN